MVLTLIPDWVKGEKCWCGKPAFQKIKVDHHPDFQGHTMNAYICEEHFYFAFRGCSKEKYIERYKKNSGGKEPFKDIDFV